MEAAAPARAVLVGSASRANVVRNGTAAPAERGTEATGRGT